MRGGRAQRVWWQYGRDSQCAAARLRCGAGVSRSKHSKQAKKTGVRTAKRRGPQLGVWRRGWLDQILGASRAQRGWLGNTALGMPQDGDRIGSGAARRSGCRAHRPLKTSEATDRSKKAIHPQGGAGRHQSAKNQSVRREKGWGCRGTEALRTLKSG